MRRILRPISNLVSQWQFYLLLGLLVPLMYSLHWIAIRFPILYPDYLETSFYEIEPDRQALFVEYYGGASHWSVSESDHVRIWLLDYESETLKLIPCPAEFVNEWSKKGPAWPKPIGMDEDKNIVFRARDLHGQFISWSPRTGIVNIFDLLPDSPQLINSRYLATSTSMRNGKEFIWYDLRESEYRKRSALILNAPSGFSPIAGTNSFYFVLPPTTHNGMDANPLAYSGDLGLWFQRLNAEGGTEYRLPPIVVNPNAPVPSSTVVLMNLTEQGPKELARWEILDHSSSEFQATSCYMICQSLEADFLNVHDALTGKIVTSLPIPKSALSQTWNRFNTPSLRLNHFSVTGFIVDFEDSTGKRIAYDIRTGMSLNSDELVPPSSFWVAQNEDEFVIWTYKSRRSDWPGVMHVHSAGNQECLYSWRVPEKHFTYSYSASSDIGFSADGRYLKINTADFRVVFVDKVTGKIARHIRPRYWLPAITFALAIAFGAWIVSWIRLSMRSGITYWVDSLVIVAIAMTFLYWRIYLWGRSSDNSRLAWISVWMLLLGAITLFVNRRLFSRARRIYRWGPLIVTPVVSIVVQWELKKHYAATDAIAQLTYLLMLIFVSITVHFIFFRTARKQKSNGQGRAMVSLRQIFGWTALAALVLATLQLYDIKEWTRGLSDDSFRNIAVDSLVISVLSVSAYYLTVKRCFLIFQVLAVLALVGLISLSVVYRQGWVDLNIELWPSFPLYSIAVYCELSLLLILATVLVALPIGIRERWKVLCPD